MRPLEILLALLLGAGALLLWRRARNRGLLGWLVVAELLTLLLHAAFEWPHWQMIPAYVAALGMPLAVAQRLWLRRTAAAVMAALLLATLGASWMVPMFRLPRPTGQYAIGTRVLEVVNSHPADAGAAGADGKRALVFQVWYPAQRPLFSMHADYRRLKETEAKSSYQAVLSTHSHWNAPFSHRTGPLPVLLLNPAWNARRTLYTYLSEELASYGYLVVGIDHTGNSGPTLFADGHVDPPASQPGDPDGLDFATHTLAQLDTYTSQQLAIQTEDDRFVLDALEAWNADPSSPFYQRLDLTRVGALGHSFGGATAIEAARTDPRVRSALDFDGSFWGAQAVEGTSKPMILIEEDVDQPSAEALKDQATLNNHLLDVRDAAMVARSHGIHVHVHGSTHSSFSDQSLYSHVARYSGVGTIPAYREYAILRALTVAFFDKTLRGEHPPILDGQTHPFPEITVEQK